MTEARRSEPSAKSQSRVLTIGNIRGLHARAAAKFVKCAENFDAEIIVSRKGEQVSATSIMGLLMLAAGPGSRIGVSATGAEAAKALNALSALVDERFGEE